MDFTPPPTQRVRTPTVLQMEAVECGAAALAMVMAYYKKIVPLEELRIECGVSRDGSNAASVMRAAKKYGFDVSAYKKEVSELNDVKVPYIVFWEFNHFLVVEGFKKDKVYLNDPAMGPRVVTYEEFDQSFTGIVLVIRPGENFQPSRKQTAALLTDVVKRLSGHSTPLIFAFLTGLGLAIPGLLIPVFTKVFVDNYLIDGLHTWLKPLLIGMAITAIVRACLTWMKEACLIKLQIKISTITSSRFFTHLLYLPMVFFGQRSVGDICYRLGLNDVVAIFIANKVLGSILNAVLAIFYIALMFFYSVKLTLIAIFMALLNIIFLISMARIRKDKSQQMVSEASALMGSTITGLLAIETLKATSREGDFFTRHMGQQTKYTNVFQTFYGLTLPLGLLPELLTGINTAVILGAGSFQIIHGILTIGALVAFQSLTTSFTTLTKEIVSNVGEFQELQGNIYKINDVMNNKPTGRFQNLHMGETEKLPLDHLNKLSGYVEMRDITFGYNPLAAPLLQDFNLKLSPGSSVAIVGRSGSGKSTTARLLMELFLPWKGEIFFDDIPVQQIARYILANSVAMVDQSVFIFEGTVAENITMWNTHISEEDIIQAAKDACIHTEIMDKIHGYQTILEEGGRNFSGGQRQRLEIARALVKNPSVIVLDEATSALDAITEFKIVDNLRRRGCTMIIIAHRLSTIRNCDEILVLEQGNVVQRGNHEKLIQEEDGAYKKLVSVES